jgi:hypothetical protein
MAAIPNKRQAATAHDDAQMPQPDDEYIHWRLYCSALIVGACDGLIGYARAFIARGRWAKSREVRDWLADCECLRGESREARNARVAEKITDLIANWRNHGNGIRRLGQALANGERVWDYLSRTFSGWHGPCTLARCALGDDLPPSQRAARWFDTVADLIQFMPPPPASVAARWAAKHAPPSSEQEERERRAAISAQEREAKAEAIVDDVMRERADLA